MCGFAETWADPCVECRDALVLTLAFSLHYYHCLPQEMLPLAFLLLQKLSCKRILGEERISVSLQ